jgi:hypothetical protein
MQSSLYNIRNEFLTRFSHQKLGALTLEEYALNRQDKALSKNSFCYWLETKTIDLGSIQGATSLKFGVYLGKTKSDPTIKWRWANWTDESFDTIKKALLDLYDAGEREDIDAIMLNPLSPMVKGKFLSLYFSDRYLNIFAVPHLLHFLNKLSVRHNPSADPVVLREELIRYKNSSPRFLGMSLTDFAHGLYGKYGYPSSEEAQNMLADKLYENSQKDIINSTFKKVPVFSDTPEARPEQIATSYGQVYKIDPAKSRRAIIDSGYMCEVDSGHESFTRKDGVNLYTEAHHLIPRCFQDQFENSLDVPANIVSLCSNCHNWLHYGIGFEAMLK